MLNFYINPSNGHRSQIIYWSTSQLNSCQETVQYSTICTPLCFHVLIPSMSFIAVGDIKSVIVFFSLTDISSRQIFSLPQGCLIFWSCANVAHEWYEKMLVVTRSLFSVVCVRQFSKWSIFLCPPSGISWMNCFNIEEEKHPSIIINHQQQVKAH